MNHRESHILLIGVICATMAGLFYPVAVKYLNSFQNHQDNQTKQELSYTEPVKWECLVPQPTGEELRELENYVSNLREGNTLWRKMAEEEDCQQIGPDWKAYNKFVAAVLRYEHDTPNKDFNPQSMALIGAKGYSELRDRFWRETFDLSIADKLFSCSGVKF